VIASVPVLPALRGVAAAAALTFAELHRPFRMQHIYLSVVVAVVAISRAHASPGEVLVGGSCDGCDAVFEGRPAKLSSSARIAPVGEPGEPMVIKGVVTDVAKRPVAGVIVYAYHTNAQGKYPSTEEHRKSARHRHGMLRAFVQTDAEGRYSFETIRPASYPVPNAPPQHVHMHIVEPGRCHYFIDELVFTDDPRLPADARKQQASARGGSGVSTPTTHNGVWSVRRDITLGANIADYPACGSKKARP
jgi:protocatechuate 3,4-dioxygenase beta subunit